MKKERKSEELSGDDTSGTLDIDTVIGIGLGYIDNSRKFR